MSGPAINRLFDNLDPPLWVVTAAHEDRRGGLIATFVTPASIVPEFPRVVMGLACHHETRRLIEASGAFALHTLNEAHLDWVRCFGLQSSRDGRDKFADLKVRLGETGAPILSDAPGWLECRVTARFDIGDRTLYLADVLAGELRNELPLLRVCRMLEMVTKTDKDQLREQLTRDALVDAAALKSWRARQG